MKRFSCQVGYAVALLLLWTISPFRASSQHEDSLLIAPNTPFLKDLISKKNHVFPFTGAPNGIVKTTYKYNQTKGQVLIPTKDGLFLFLDWTGILYKSVQVNDDEIVFRRLDSTINLNYNGAGWIYEYNHEIHNLGGYSFWKNNGLDKKFNPRDRQWDVVPLSEELFTQNFPVMMLWNDHAKDAIWIPYQIVYNSGVTDLEMQDGKLIPKTYQLDLRSKKWTEKGDLRPELLKLLKNTSRVVQTETGLLFASSGHLYFIGFNKNEVLRMTDNSINQSFMRIGYMAYLYHYEKMLYYFDPLSQKYDSLKFDPAKLEKMDFPIYEKSDKVLYYALLSVGVILIGIFFYRKKYNRRVGKEDEQEFREVQELPKNGTSPLEFTEKETNLLLLLKNNSLQSKTTSLEEINYVLGLKDKNVGLQKKVRSDVMNSIHEKYKLIGKKTDPLIQSKRSPHDKRYLEYFLQPEDCPI